MVVGKAMIIVQAWGGKNLLNQGRSAHEPSSCAWPEALPPRIELRSKVQTPEP